MMYRINNQFHPDYTFLTEVSNISRSSAEYMKWVQNSLNKILNLNLAVDGISGTYTKSAIRSFQSKNKLTVDGIVGPITEAALIRSGASLPPGSINTIPSYPSPTPPPPAKGSLRGNLTAAALQEWNKWGQGSVNEASSSIQSTLRDYWVTGTGSDYGYVNNLYWSAAFISWVVKKAGGRTNFKYSGAHTTYTYAAKQNRLQNNSNPFKAYRTNEKKPEPGDIIVQNRGTSSFTYDNLQPDQPGTHGDIVVQVNSGSIYVIGGNVSNSVSGNNYYLDSNGYLNSPAHFAIIKIEEGTKGVYREDEFELLPELLHGEIDFGNQWMLMNESTSPPMGSTAKKEFKQFILVAGVNYENLRNKLKSYCENRMTRWKKVNTRKIDLRFIVFDVAGGTVETYDVTFGSGKETISKKIDNRFSPVTAASYETVVKSHGVGFKKGQADVMSILDIFSAVQEIGKKNPGTLVELSFFSHGWMGGPILVNSCDHFDSNSRCFGSVKKPERDPDDKYPRSSKDFIYPTMDPTLLKQFRDAFHPNGFTWLWGCTFTKEYFWTLSKVIKKYGVRGLTDSKAIKLEYSAEQINFIRNCDTTGDCSSKPIIWDTTFGEIKTYLCEGMRDTYASAIANASGRKTYAALLGTYATYQNGKSVRNPLMTVEGFTSIKQFYSKYFSISLDPSGLGYGTYSPGIAC